MTSAGSSASGRKNSPDGALIDEETRERRRGVRAVCADLASSDERDRRSVITELAVTGEPGRPKGIAELRAAAVVGDLQRRYPGDTVPAAELAVSVGNAGRAAVGSGLPVADLERVRRVGQPVPDDMPGRSPAAVDQAGVLRAELGADPGRPEHLHAVVVNWTVQLHHGAGRLRKILTVGVGLAGVQPGVEAVDRDAAAVVEAEI